MRPTTALGIVTALEELMADTGAVVQLVQGRGHPVVVTAAWTRWAPMRFTSRSLSISLREAIDCREHYRRAHPND